MTDFIGQPITPGCWVAMGGAGNRAAEYGMILYWVEEVTAKGIRAGRLVVDYNNPGRAAKATVRYSTLKKGTKVVVVQPKQAVTSLFSRIEDGTATQKDHELVGTWIHGQTEGMFK